MGLAAFTHHHRHSQSARLSHGRRSATRRRQTRQLRRQPAAVEEAADPEHLKTIREMYGGRAQMIINILLAFDAYFNWYYPLLEDCRGLLGAELEKKERVVASEAMQILGGAGYLRGNLVERVYREVKVMAIGGGSEEIMRDLAARQMGL